MSKADIEKRVAAFYDDRLPYHNFDHVKRAILAGEEIMESCREGGVSFNEDAVYYAILLHDAGFHEDHTALGFESKEAYSAEIAREFLRQMPVSQSTIDKVVSAILCTHIDGQCRTTEDKIVRKADISGMASEYEQFRCDTVNLKRELEMLSGKAVTWDDWKQQAYEKINLFLREDLGLTDNDYDRDGTPVFNARVRQNLDRMMSDESFAREQMSAMPLYYYYCKQNDKTVEVEHTLQAKLSTWGEVCFVAQIPMGDTDPLAPVERLIKSPPNIASTVSNSELKSHGFTKLVKRDDGLYENVTATGDESRYMKRGDKESVPHIHKKIKD